MHISVRSTLIAGTTAVVGASAVAMTPVVAAPAHISVLDKTTVALAAFVNPITVLGETLQDFTDFSFSAEYVFGPADPLFYVVGSPQLGVIPQLLSGGFLPDSPETPDDGVYYYGTPALRAIGNNFSQYSYALLTGLNALTGGVGGFGVLTDALTYIGTNIFQNLVDTGSRLLAGLTDLTRILVGQAVYLSEKLVAVGSAVISALPDFEAAWNIAIEGTLGPTGLLGDVVNLTQGFGIVGAVEPTEDNPIGLLPSGRTVATVFTRDWSDSIFNDPYSPPAPPPIDEDEDDGPPVEDDVPPVEDDVSPVEDVDVLPVEDVDVLPVEDVDVLPAADDGPTAEDDAPAAEDDAPAVADDAPAAADDGPASDRGAAKERAGRN